MVRLKHRYLLINILYPDGKNATTARGLQVGEDVPYTVQFRRPSSDRLDGKLLMRIIRDGVAELFGDYGSGKVAGSLQVKYFSSATSTAIVRVSRDHYRLVWTTLTFLTRLPRPVDQPCAVQVVRVSGTIKKAEEEAIRRARLSIRQARKGSAKIGAGALHNGAMTASLNDLEMDDEEGEGLTSFENIEDLDVSGDEEADDD